MLSLAAIAPPTPTVTAVDPHVPLAVETERHDGSATVYWRAVPNRQTLVEVGLSETSGEWRSLTVTSIPPASVRVAGEATGVPAHAEEGLPRFDLSEWSGGPSFGARFRDAPVEVCLLLGPGSCAVELGGPASWASAIRMGGILFVFDHDRVLRRVQVTGLSGDQMEVLAGLAGLGV